MKRILNFKEYNINESVSFDGYKDFLELPEKIKRYLKKVTSKNRFSKSLGPNFSIILEGNRLHFIYGERNVEFPFIIFTDGNIIADTETIADPDNYKKFEKDLFGKELNSKWSIESIMDKFASRTSTYSTEYTQSIETVIGRYISDMVDHIYRESLSQSTEINFLNPFDTDLDSNESIKTLKQMGVHINSTDKQKKNGTLQFESDFLSGNIGIYTNGYIRRITDRPSPITTNIELTRPILTEDDLNLKLAYVIVYCIKTILKNSGATSKQISKISKSFSNGDFISYDEIILDIAKDSPEISHKLPDPNNIIPSTLKRGSAILSRFNLFDL